MIGTAQNRTSYKLVNIFSKYLSELNESKHVHSIYPKWSKLNNKMKMRGIYVIIRKGESKMDFEENYVDFRRNIVIMATCPSPL